MSETPVENGAPKGPEKIPEEKFSQNFKDGVDQMVDNILIDRDLEFMDSRTAAAHRMGSRFAYILSLMVLAFLVAFLVWASFAELEEVTRGSGRVVPSRQIQVVQNLEGGILSEIKVRNGDLVDTGDVLVRIDNVGARSSYQEAKGSYLVHLGAIARLEAVMEGAEPVYPEEVLQADPDILRNQLNQADARQAQYQSQVGVLEAQADQKGKEIEELKSRQRQLRMSVSIVKQEYEITQPLYEKGIVSRLDLLRVEEKMGNQSGELRTIGLSIPRARSAFEEANQRIEEFKNKHRAEVAEELGTLRAELDALRQRMAAGEDRVVRTDVRSPVRGTIKDVKANTIGGVIQPGQDIVEIVPIDDTLLIEAQIKPSDIAFLRPGQSATVKITAYDFSIYGGLEAELEQISADTIEDEKGDQYFRILLRTGKNALTHNREQLPIIPGMTASVEILTGNKTVMSYLLKPILKAKQEALRER